TSRQQCRLLVPASLAQALIMNKMRLRADFCDVRLLLGGSRCSVSIRWSSSPYFSALFSGWMSEADKEEVQILGVEAQMLEVLLEFIYTASSCHEMYHLLSV
uniref:BTB domain-containing protein n=1 Tax=Oncorhynchus kisutch TaxID=8019 RepID=A0A8C7H2I5_ONCKI